MADADPDCPKCEGKGWVWVYGFLLSQKPCDCTKRKEDKQ
jgi:hypothetical protein